MTAEEWRDIPGLEGAFQASSLGRVRGLDRVVWSAVRGREIRRRGQILKTYLPRTGYLVVNINYEGRKGPRTVHSLVAAAFHGTRPDGMCTRHLNGVKADNRAANLAYGTYSENALDTVAHGHNPHANKTHCPEGHELAGDNLYRWGTHRQCRACRAATDVRLRPRVRPKVYPHGTVTRYRHGCKCDECRAANATKARERRARVKEKVA